jgi:fumarate hydratase class II
MIEQHLEACLMLVTALTPHIGYEKSAEIALLAHREDLSLRDAALKLGYVNEEQFEEWVDAEEMTHPLSED